MIRYDYCVMLLYGATCLFYAPFIARGNNGQCVREGVTTCAECQTFSIESRPIYIVYHNMITYRVSCLF